MLSEKPHFTHDIVGHIWEEWSDDYMELTPYKTQEELADFFFSTCKDDDIPVCYVLHDDVLLLGFCMIDKEDMQVCPHLSPWLSTVYILPEHRNKGYASYMIKSVLNMQRHNEQHTHLYLWTFNMELAALYNRFGFEIIETIPKHGKHENLLLMRRITHCMLA